MRSQEIGIFQPVAQQAHAAGGVAVHSARTGEIFAVYERYVARLLPAHGEHLLRRDFAYGELAYGFVQLGGETACGRALFIARELPFLFLEYAAHHHDAALPGQVSGGFGGRKQAAPRRHFGIESAAQSVADQAFGGQGAPVRHYEYVPAAQVDGARGEPVDGGGERRGI